MEKHMPDYIVKLLLKQKRRKCWYRVISILACMVVFCTSYALILPAITMEREAYYGQEESPLESEETSVEPEEPSTEAEGSSVESEELSTEPKEPASESEETPVEPEEAVPEAEGSPVESEELSTEPKEPTSESEETPMEPEEAVPEAEGSPAEPEEAVPEVEESPVEPEEAVPEVKEPFVEPEELSVEPKETGSNGQAGESAECILEAVGEDYMVTVIYDENAAIPDGAVLNAEEYAEGSAEYQMCFEEANAALLEDGSCIYRARFFDISIMAGGSEIEPQSVVKVVISQSPDIAENTENIVITHATEEGTDVISEVELKQEENGYVTTTFETESFSDYGTISAGQSVTIGVGDTVTLQGTNGNRNIWFASPEGCVTIETNGKNAVITGVAAGTASITHTYTNKGVSESFTVVVEDGLGSMELEAAGQDYTISVKGNKNILTDDVVLHVEDYKEEEPDYQDYYTALAEDIENLLSKAVNENDFDFLHMYHIYLTKAGIDGEYIPDGNVNLQVTITYGSVPEGWPDENGNLYVGHYKRTDGSVDGVDISDGSSSSMGVKQIRVSGNSITFHIRSFSVFPVAVLSDDTGGDNTGNETVQEPSLVQPGSDNTYGTNLATAAKNEWQIVSGKYSGNAGTDKASSEDTLVRVQKNVVPTDIENEFLVYLAIDKKVSWEEVIQNSGLLVTTSGSYKKIGEMYESIHGNYGEVSPEGPGENEYTATVTLTRDGVAVETFTQKYYGTVPNCSNATGFLKLTIDGKTTYVTASTSVNLHEDGSGTGGALTYTVPLESLEEKFDFADFTVTYDGIEDVMGEYIIYDNASVPSGNYDGIPLYDPEKKMLSWKPIQKSGLLPIYTTKTKTTGWYLNSSEFVYRIKLDVTKAGFQSTAEYLSGKGADHAYPTNASASLSYHWTGENANDRITSFSSPEVRGLLYDVVFDKVDADDSTKGVEGAQFVLNDSSGAVLGEIHTSGDQTRYEIAAGIPYGSYILTETLPAGYSAVGETAKTITLCYTDAGDDLIPCETDAANMRNTGADGGFLTIENKKVEIKLVFKKADMNDNPLSDAKFKIYDEHRQALEKGLLSSGTDGVFTPENFTLEPGTYYLEEIQAPDGYQLPDGMFRMVITSGSISVFNYDSNIEGNYGDAPSKYFSVQNNEAEVTIYNSTGIELPATGGGGTLFYTFNGSGFMLISVLLYGYSMRRRRERRSV